MMYAAEDTAFMTWAKAHGAEKVLDGFGMLVEQAAEAFYIWRGIRPETQSVIKALRL
jgi:shikimate dehydrogenase